MSGGPRADELDLEVYFGVVLGFALYLPQICVKVDRRSTCKSTPSAQAFVLTHNKETDVT